MKSTIKVGIPALSLLIFSLLQSCSKEELKPSDPTANLVKQAEGYAAGAATRVVVFTASPALETGYTPLYVALYDSITGKAVNDGHVRLNPLMDMGTMMHAAPYENPASEEAVDGIFLSAVVFTMPSTAGTWTVRFDIHNHTNDKEGSLTVHFTVTEPSYSRMKSFTSLHDGAKYFMALIEPAAPKIGINEMEIAVYKKASMMNFPPDSALSFLLTPEMPSMGHGSPNNVNPVHTGLGHYKGKVNFTMTGLWRVHLDSFHEGAVADSTQYFDIVF